MSNTSNDYPEFLIDKLIQFSKISPNKPVFSYLNDSCEVSTSLTYNQLLLKSQSVASSLLSNYNIKAGDRVLLVYPPSLDFFVAFLACIQVGIIAVPTFPPDPNRLNKDLSMFAAIATSSGAKVALTSTLYSFATKIAGLKNVFTSSGGLNWPDLSWIVTDTIASTAVSLELPTLSPESIAFLQYTSGSTSEPKGVMITHGNLSHNLKLIITGLQAVEDTVVVSWLPQYHDMGLIGSYLGIIYCGGSGFYLSPYAFIRNPSIWVQAMSQYKATHMQAPNFAYTLTSRKFLSLVKSIGSSSYMKNKYSWIERLDLSSVRHMINAAEPVEASAIDNFYAVFGKFGLKRVIFPTYGLAEHTVYVCSNGQLQLTIDKQKLEVERIVQPVESGSEGSIVVVGCGKPSSSDGLTLKIVESTTGTVLPEKQVGEIWLKSKSRALGYWGLPDKSEEDFNAKLGLDQGEASIPGLGEGGFLRTGDLGFIYDGELFVTGRVKDLIIIRGRNHYPQDIERSCETKSLQLDQSVYPIIRGGCSAAFSIPIAGQEVLVYAAELDRSIKDTKVLQEFISFLRQTITSIHSIEPSVICLLEPRTISKTTSGKIARQWVRKAYLTDSLKSVYIYNGLDRAIDDGLDGNILPSKAQTKPDEENQAIDPEGKPIDEIIDILKEAVASCTNLPVTSIDATVPLVRQGMDSMLGVQLQSVLESKFSVPIPEELMFESDCTLQTLANALITGGVVKSRPRLIDGTSVALAAIERVRTNRSKTVPKGALSPEWFRKLEIKGDVDTQLFPNGYSLQQKAISSNEYSKIKLAYYLAIILPITFITVLSFLPIHISLTIGIITLSTLYLVPSKSSFPPSFRTSALTLAIIKYFNYRVIYEVKIDTAQPTIYSFGPYGTALVSPIIQTLIHEFIFNENFHLVFPSKVFAIPIIRNMLMFIGCVKDTYDNKKSIIKSGRSIGIISGGISESFLSNDSNEVILVKPLKDTVKLSLEMGTQLVPVYCFGSTIIYKKQSKLSESISSYLGLSITPLFSFPKRTPLTTVFGRPIPCPQTSSPSAELVNEYTEMYLREIRRLYEKFRNTHNWDKKELIFKR